VVRRTARQAHHRQADPVIVLDWFLTDFVFKIRCPQRSLFNQAAEPDRVYYELIPDGYREDLLREPTITDGGKIIVYTNDEDLFWQQPS
jgi:hypothetical protein